MFDRYNVLQTVMQNTIVVTKHFYDLRFSARANYLRQRHSVYDVHSNKGRVAEFKSNEIVFSFELIMFASMNM